MFQWRTSIWDLFSKPSRSDDTEIADKGGQRVKELIEEGKKARSLAANK